MTEAGPACGTCSGPLVATASAIAGLADRARDAEARAETAQEALERALVTLEALREAAADRAERLTEYAGDLSARLTAMENLLLATTAEQRGRLAAQEARTAEVMTRLADVELAILDAIARLRKEASP